MNKWTGPAGGEGEHTLTGSQQMTWWTSITKVHHCSCSSCCCLSLSLPFIAYASTAEEGGPAHIINATNPSRIEEQRKKKKTKTSIPLPKSFLNDCCYRGSMLDQSFIAHRVESPLLLQQHSSIRIFSAIKEIFAKDFEVFLVSSSFFFCGLALQAILKPSFVFLSLLLGFPWRRNSRKLFKEISPCSALVLWFYSLLEEEVKRENSP